MNVQPHFRTATIDIRTRMVVSSYSRKFKTFEVKFAVDIAGDGNHGITGNVCRMV